ncbi:PIG-X-domain-containing protein [Sporormia fimetaria CBS 119925]|uniref:Protein PBN1 n=1 Tax=Sporormia fimetaria CBS 119925 TaxID=1340428 RepID=A0A6A6VLL8_9PLEO|nr:PIG-X-domain-containing protein [Sporormia fimetaria CBS 119925]
MKQRITYLVPEADDFHPDLLSVRDASLSVRNLKAAKEHRITVGLSELPEKLRNVLGEWRELHIRWVSETPYDAPPPFTSRVSPGLHVFFTPEEKGLKAPLCPLLRQTFGHELKCNSTVTAFTKAPILSKRFSHSPSLQYHSHLPSITHLIRYIQDKLCPPSSSSCKNGASSLDSTSYTDIDYDTISHALTLNAFFPSAPDPSIGWTETISLPSTSSTIEIGILNHEPNPDPEDIAFAGFLTVLGKDTKPVPTRFQTITRHYPLSTQTTYKAHFQQPTGLHPTLQLTLTPPLTPPAQSCKLHTYLTLPSHLFLDPYSFRDPLFLASHNLTALHSLAGNTDLEAPDWVVSEWGSAALLELAIPPSTTSASSETGKEDDMTVTVPLHLRYLPAANRAHTSVPLPWPVVFWACRSEEGAAKMATNPFDRRVLGYEGLFGERTRFVHVPPAGGKVLVEWVDVPVLDLRKAGWVEMGTVGVVVAAFLVICWVLLFGGRRGGDQKKEVKSGKKKQ